MNFTLITSYTPRQVLMVEDTQKAGDRNLILHQVGVIELKSMTEVIGDEEF